MKPTFITSRNQRIGLSENKSEEGVYNCKTEMKKRKVKSVGKSETVFGIIYRKVVSDNVVCRILKHEYEDELKKIKTKNYYESKRNNNANR